MAIGLSLLLSACGDGLRPEKVYDNAVKATEEVDTVMMQRNQTLRAQDESFSTSMVGHIRYEPLEALTTMRISLINLSEPVQMNMYLNEDKWLVRPEQYGADWEERDRSSFDDVVFEQPTVLLEEFMPYREQFLMKEIEIVYNEDATNQIEDVAGEATEEEGEADKEKNLVTYEAYEVSFRGSDEQYKPLIRQHIEQMGLADLPGVNLDEVMETVQIERIDMTARIEKETFYVHRFHTRFRYLVEILGEYRVIDESLLLRFKDHNEPIDFEALRAEAE